MKDKHFTINLMSDGWEVLCEDVIVAAYDHNDEDLGAYAVEMLLNRLGISNTLEEIY